MSVVDDMGHPDEAYGPLVFNEYELGFCGTQGPLGSAGRLISSIHMYLMDMTSEGFVPLRLYVGMFERRCMKEFKIGATEYVSKNPNWYVHRDRKTGRQSIWKAETVKECQQGQPERNLSELLSSIIRMIEASNL